MTTADTLYPPLFAPPHVLEPAADSHGDTRTLAKFLAISAAAAIALFTLLSVNVETSAAKGAQCRFIGGTPYPLVLEHASAKFGGRTHAYTGPAAKPTSLSGYGSCASVK